MKKLYSLLFLSFVLLGYSQNYWKKESVGRKESKESFYTLDLPSLRKYLKSGNSVSDKSSVLLVYVPDLEGNLEQFKVKSYPVMDTSLAELYQLDSYVGVSVENPSKSIRFSVSPYDFQSMVFNGSNYQFVEPERNNNKYSIHEKTLKSTSGSVFECKTNEDIVAVNQLKSMIDKSSLTKTANNSGLYAKSSDKKYRTLRLALSVTGEYTRYFGGIPQALAQINATLTRVNAVFEKELALHLNMINAPQLIYTDPATDPYSNSKEGVAGAWNLELQKTLTKEIGENNYDIGHLFGATGGGGNAGCVGCICKSPLVDNKGIPFTKGKGSAFTSPADGKPFGDSFDIDFVAHEMGHQLGANHTFSHKIEGTLVQTEPGSGSTIMGYAGITNANVQMHSDAYFNYASFYQIQSVLATATCDTEISVTNNPPVIEPLKDYSIPKGTPFVLDAKVTDPEGDSMTYNWEQNDSASMAVSKVVSTNVAGPNFRSVSPSKETKRYFPKFSSVMAGKLTNVEEWESVSNVKRTMSFVFTARDNNVLSQEQQLSNTKQNVYVTNDGPFVVKNYNVVYYGRAENITWDIANTTASPYDVTNVKIDYTMDGGVSWNIISDSTPNDGSEVYHFPASAIGKMIQIRVTSIGNIFYTISSPLKVVEIKECSKTAPENFIVKIDGRIAKMYWQEAIGASYVVRYKKKTSSDWVIVNTNIAYVEISNLEDGVIYEVQVAQVCGGITGNFTSSQEFIIPLLKYCPLKAADSTKEFISNVKITNTASQTLLNNTSTGTGYANFFDDITKLIYLKRASSNQLMVELTFPGVEDYYETLSVWVDYNGDGILSDSERQNIFIPDPSNGNVGKLSKSFMLNVPATAMLNTSLKMRIALKIGPSINSVPSSSCNAALIGSSYLLQTYKYGEVEDYRVKITE